MAQILNRIDTNIGTSAGPISNRQNGTLSALRIPSFQWFLTGTTLTNAAHWIQQVTLNWLVYDLTSSGALLGTLNLIRSIPTVGLAPIAGVAIDRISRCKLLYATNGWSFSISLGFGLMLVGFFESPEPGESQPQSLEIEGERFGNERKWLAVLS
jgi:hypothetical protein